MEFSLPRMIRYIKVKFRVIVSQYRAKNDNSELGIFTSKHDSTRHKKIRVIVFMHKGQKRQLGTRNSPENEFRDFREFRVNRHGQILYQTTVQKMLHMHVEHCINLI